MSHNNTIMEQWLQMVSRHNPILVAFNYFAWTITF